MPEQLFQFFIDDFLALARALERARRRKVKTKLVGEG
jgi:hypothetical protein